MLSDYDIKRVFASLQGMYGSRWLDMWRLGQTRPSDGADLGLLNAQQTWAKGLAHIPAYAISAAIEACSAKPFPPTLPEFLDLCRQRMTLDGTASRLPAPRVSPEVARDRAARLQERAEQIAAKAPGHDYKKWAKDILANPKAYPSISLKFAKQALGIIDEPAEQPEPHREAA